MKKKSKKKSFKQRWSRFKKNLFGEDASKNSFSIFEVIIIILISILFGVIIGYLLSFSKSAPSSIKDSDNMSEIIDTYNDILNNYYGEVDSDELKDGAIQGMIHSLKDPYSIYMDQDTTVNFQDTVDGSFVGIGVRILYQDSYNEVIEVFENGPAEEAGLQIGDIIKKVDGEDVEGIVGADLSKKIRGEKGTKVVLTILREDEEMEITVKRDVVELKSVTSTTFDDVGYIKIDSFATNTASQFQEELARLEKESIQGLIIDVRGNPGGHLLQTRQMLSMFFPKKTVLYQSESKNKKTKVTSNTKETRDYPVVILIDSGSASAAEVFASCFQDNYKEATIIGVTSYGKGTVQKSETYSNGSSIKYTTQKWLTSKGEWLNEKGVTPDIEVEQSDEYVEDPIYEKDSQLQAGIQKIKESK